MQLDDFVFETIKQIVNGVSRAKKHCDQEGSKVNPENIMVRTKGGTNDPIFCDSKTGQLIDRVEFDVAVTTTEGKQDKAGVGIFVGPIGLGAQGQSRTEDQSMSRVRFTVPVQYP